MSGTASLSASLMVIIIWPILFRFSNTLDLFFLGPLGDEVAARFLSESKPKPFSLRALFLPLRVFVELGGQTIRPRRFTSGLGRAGIR